MEELEKILGILRKIDLVASVHFIEKRNNYRLVINVYDDTNFEGFDHTAKDLDELLVHLRKYFHLLKLENKKLLKKMKIDRLVFVAHFAWHILVLFVLALGTVFSIVVLHYLGVIDQLLTLVS